MLKKLRFLPSEIKLAESKEGSRGPASRVQVMRTGQFKHPEYGNFTITKEHLDGFVKNFKDGVRGIDISIDYKHDSEAEAAAWFKELQVDQIDGGAFGLFAEVDWTEPGAEKVAKKEYRYLSADFTLSYKGNEDDKTYGPVLLGAGLTNRPFIKGMEPVVQLSEQEKGVNGMTLEQAMAKIAELEAQLKAMGAGQMEMGQMKQQLGDMQKQFSEAQKIIDGYKAKEAEAEKVTKLAEKKGTFDKMLSEKKVVEAQREAFMADDFAKFAELSVPAPKDKKLSEGGEGGNGGEDNSDKDAQDQVLALAEGLVKEKKAPSLSKAITMVLADPENKKLRDEYNSLV